MLRFLRSLTAMCCKVTAVYGNHSIVSLRNIVEAASQHSGRSPISVSLPLVLINSRLGHTSLHDSFSTRSTRRRGSALESQSRHSPEPNTHNASVPQFASTGGSAWGVRSRHSLDLGLNQHDTATSQPHHERPQSDFWALLEGFRPSGSLNKQVMSGNLEMENITHTQSHSEVAQRSRDADFVPADDPIRLGIVNSSIAATLFSR